MGSDSTGVNRGLLLALENSERMECHDDEVSMLRSVFPIDPKRRDKQHVPDLAKDDRYWEKRKRNNIAARKSRDNKRKLENVIRSRMDYLEEENMLLKKELSILKERMNLPVGVSILTEADRDECLSQLMESSHRSGNGSTNQMSPAPRDQYEQSSASAASSPEHSPSNQFYYVLSAQSPSQISPSQIIQKQKSPSQKSPSQIASFIKGQPPVQAHSKRGSNAFSDNPRDIVDNLETYKRQRMDDYDPSMMPADLSTRKSNTSDDGKVVETVQPTSCVSASSSPRAGSGDSAVVDLTDDLGDENSDIRVKLQLLSEQVEKMQKTITSFDKSSQIEIENR